MFTDQQIIEIAALPATCFKFKAHVETLVGFYKWIRQQWTVSAQNELKTRHNLDLRQKTDRLKFAWHAAKELSQDCLPPAKEDSPIHPKAESQLAKILCQAIALLPPSPPTNGIEKAPAYKIMGEPVYADELVRNYKLLAKKWHPDNNPSVEAVGRFQLIQNIYITMRKDWFAKYSPFIPKERLGDKAFQLAYAKTFDWTPESFWT